MGRGRNQLRYVTGTFGFNLVIGGGGRGGGKKAYYMSQEVFGLIGGVRSTAIVPD